MTVLTWTELTAFLDTAAFTGVLFEGQFTRHNGIRRFFAMPTPVYLESDRGLLKLAADGNGDGAKIGFSVVPTPTWESFGEDWAELGEVGVVDEGFQYFGDRQSTRCTELRCAFFRQAGPTEHPGGALVVEMNFSGEERILFDPWRFSGIRVRSGLRLEDAAAMAHYPADRVIVRSWSRQPCLPA